MEYHLPAFREALDAGAHSVMVNSGIIDNEPVHASRRILTGLLRDELGFDGRSRHRLRGSRKAARPRPSGRDLQGGRSHRHQCRNRHGDDPDRLPGLLPRPVLPGRRGRRTDGTHRRGRAAHSETQIRTRTFRASEHPARRLSPLQLRRAPAGLLRGRSRGDHAPEKRRRPAPARSRRRTEDTGLRTQRPKPQGVVRRMDRHVAGTRHRTSPRVVQDPRRSHRRAVRTPQRRGHSRRELRRAREPLRHRTPRPLRRSRGGGTPG